MISVIEQLRESEASYRPCLEIEAHINPITMVAVVGPLATGKSTCIDTATSFDSDFGRVRSFTTRPIRDGEAITEYRFLQHNADTIRDISVNAEAGLLVQYAIHPTTGFIYGSDASDYSHPYMLLDTLASNVNALRSLPFGKLVEITLVTDPETWERRFIKNATVNDAQKRLIEGVASLEWSLEHGDDMVWVTNHSGLNKIPSVAREIIGISRGKLEQNPTSRLVGEKLLSKIRELVS